MPASHGILARGPWAPDQVRTRWRQDHFEPPSEASRAADEAIAALRERGSPSHDGASARLADFEAAADRLGEDAAQALASLCVARAADGRWLAGRRAPWVASWAGRWALGAGGAVEVGENPAQTLARELEEEWSLEPERLSVEALVRIPSGLILFVGMAWLADGAEVVPDDEHDAHAWWPADIDAWPPEADEPLRLIGRLLAEG